MSASSTTDTTSTHMTTTGELPGLHGRLTVLPAGPRDRHVTPLQFGDLTEMPRDRVPSNNGTDPNSD